MTAPFEFVACLQLREMLGRTAWDERELLTGIEHVPADSIYYHTHSSFLRSRYPSAPYPNDFATWVATQVRDPVLGERLAVVDPFMFDDLERLRNAMLAILDDHLQAEEPAPCVGAVGRAGEPFHFMQSTIIEVPTGVRARTLGEFADALHHVDVSVIFYHMFRPVVNSGTVSDPAQWLERELGLPALAGRVRLLSPYARNLEGLRSDLLSLVEEAREREA